MSFQVGDLRNFRSGGQGDLYLGRRTDTGEPVVVKFLRESHLLAARKAFAREVQVLARKLQGIIPLLAWDTTAARPFYVMPYLPGGSLTQYAGRLTPIQLQAVAVELARTLANLHAANDVHGDVKPDNILLTGAGKAQIADPLGNGTLFTVLFSQNCGGTPGYWAPEIATGGSISRAGDVHAYGATLRHLLTGQMPQDSRHLELLWPTYPWAPKICEIIRLCCQPDPRLRPTMPEVLRLLNGDSWAEIQASRQKHQQLAAALVVGVLVLLLATAR